MKVGVRVRVGVRPYPYPYPNPNPKVKYQNPKEESWGKGTPFLALNPKP